MFEEWPLIMGKLFGAEKKKHWWTLLWERSLANNTDKSVMQQT
jgi:hypothetical protein